MNETLKNPFLAFSLHSDHICLVEADEDRIQAVLVRELIQPFDLEVFRAKEDFIENQSEVLKELYQKTSQKCKNVGVVLGLQMVLVKKISVALGLDEESIREHISWEAEQCLSEPLNSFILDYQRLPFQTPEGNPQYLIILVRKNLIEGISEVVRKVGLGLRDVDVDVFSNTRAVLANYKLEAEDTAVIVDIRREYIALAFIRKQEYYMSHRIPIDQSFMVSDADDQSEITDILLKELKRLVFGHRIGQGIDDLKTIFLVGSKEVQSVAKTLATKTHVPVLSVNPFKNVRVAQSVSQSEEFRKSPEIFTSSVGMTLKKAPNIITQPH